MPKRNLLILLFFTLVFNCTFTEQPEFVGIKNIAVVNSNLQSITLSAQASFLNPNDLGGVLETDNLKVFVNGIEVATITANTFNVPAKDDFEIPLTVSFSTDNFIDKNRLGGLLGSLISQSLKVQYKGEIKYIVLGYTSTYNIDKTQELKIKL